jgi:hypothetical protein
MPRVGKRIDIDHFGMTTYSESFCNLREVDGVVRTGMWITCRDEFHRVNKTAKLIGFNIGSCSVTQFTRNLWSVEKKLGLRRYSQVHRTNYPNIVCIRPAAWWWLFDARRSFYTILLRASCYRGGGGMMAMLRSQRYFEETWPAVERFLAGHTKFCGRMSQYEGWADTFAFYYAEEEDEKWQVLRRLVRPGRKPLKLRRRAA